VCAKVAILELSIQVTSGVSQGRFLLVRLGFICFVE
jgi:hypothetical protein